MEIRAKCRYDYASIMALTHTSVYKKSNPKKTVRIRSVVCLVLLLLFVAELKLGAFDGTFVPAIFITADILVVVIDLFMYFALPRIQYKSMAKLKDTENEYIFGENAVKVTSKGEVYNGEAEIKYSLFVKIYETSKYLFMFQTKDQAFAVDKSTIEGGSVEEIRNKLSSYADGKYYICKY